MPVEQPFVPKVKRHLEAISGRWKLTTEFTTGDAEVRRGLGAEELADEILTNLLWTTATKLTAEIDNE